MIRFYVFRHGETLWNREHRMQGQTDTELSDLGEKQAACLRDELKTLNLQVVLSSDLKRARRTAELATEGLGLELVLSPSLREAHFGTLEGMTRDEIIGAHGEQFWKDWLSIDEAHLDISAPKGETKRQVLTRARSYLEGFHRENPALTRIGVCSHGGLLARLLHAAQDSPLERLRVENCKIYQIEFDPRDHRWRWITSA